jgi:surface antigen
MYTPRLSAPSKSNAKYYKSNPFYQSGYGLPNCTTYCFGRRWELEGKKPTLSTDNAEDWWDKDDGYERGQLPRLGAVICWKKGKVRKGSDGAGHVATVEELHSDGSITIGMSGWKASKVFWTQRLYPPFKYGDGYTLQGFIYCPTVKNTDCTTVFKIGSYRGHGISTNGSWDPGTTYKGDTEAELIAPIVTAQNKYLKATGRFKIYTDPNNNINMIKQIAKSNKNKVAVHIADHCDYYEASSGSNPLYSKNSKYGKELAKYVNKYVKQYTGLKSKGLTARTDLGELNDTNMPAVVFELGSIKYDADVFKEKYDEYGKAIARGICDYFGVPFVTKEEVKEIKYIVGETYTLQYDMKVRTGPSTSYRQKKRTELTASGKKSALDGTYAVLKKGTEITCMQVKGNWIKIPSGWVCAKTKNKIYIK